jgi:hypothetical protein
MELKIGDIIQTRFAYPQGKQGGYISNEFVVLKNDPYTNHTVYYVKMQPNRGSTRNGYSILKVEVSPFILRIEK